MRSNLLIGVLVGTCGALAASSLPFDAYFAVTGGWMLDRPAYTRTIEARVASLEAWRKGVVTKGVVTPAVIAPWKKPEPIDMPYWGTVSASLYANCTPHYHGISTMGTNIVCYCAYPPDPGHSHISGDGNSMLLGCHCSNPSGALKMPTKPYKATFPIAPTKGHYHYWYFTGKRIFDTPCTCAYPPTHMHPADNGTLAPCNCSEGY